MLDPRRTLPEQLSPGLAGDSKEPMVKVKGRGACYDNFLFMGFTFCRMYRY